MKRNALIIDDNVPLTDSLNRNMNWDALQINITHILYDALNVQTILDHEHVDLIISDIRMPGISGLQMAKEVLLRYPHIKIILISAYEDFQYVQEAIRLGAFDYIEKPINLDYLSQIVEKAVRRMELDEQVKKQLEATKPALTQKFFYDILRHAPAEARFHYQEYPDFLELPIESAFHVCLFFKITNAVPLKSGGGLPAYHMALLELENHIMLWLADFPLRYILPNSSSFVLITGRTMAHTKQFMDTIQQLTEAISAFDSPLQLAVGIGNPVRSFWNLKESFDHAKLALDYRFFLPEERIFYFEDIPPQRSAPDTDLEARYKIIQNFICRNDQTGLKIYLDQLYEEYLNTHINKESLFISISDIAGKIIGFLRKMGVNSIRLDEDLVQYWGNFRHFTTSRALFEWLYDLASLACSHLDTSVSHYQNRMVSMVEEYVAAHYEDPDLGLPDIAAYVNVSPNHLSAIYKKITQKTISDRISNTRISTACDLLLHSQMTMKDISEKAGFSNQYYFSACFKKITGQTPSMFRTTHESRQE